MITAEFDTVERDGGLQVTVNGMPVYTFIGDLEGTEIPVGQLFIPWSLLDDEGELTDEDAQLPGTPTASPTGSPVASPTGSPVASPTGSPVASPTSSPQASPTGSPVASPTGSPVASPTASPQASPTGSPVASPTASPTVPAETILEIAEANDQFSVLVALLEEAGLDSTLSGSGPFTVFAPTNEAFAELEPGVLASLLEDTSALTDALAYHVVQGRFLLDDVIEMDSWVTMQGQAVDVQVDNGDVLINTAEVTSVDLQGSNGVIHVIDEVLVPEGAETITAEFDTVDRDGVTQVTINGRPVYTYTGDIENTDSPVGQFFIPWSLLGAEGELIDEEAEEFTPATPTPSPAP